MAIGDTVQAGLMKVDPSALERAGQAQAKANQAFGTALSQVAQGYIIGQEKKARANEIKDELMRAGVSEKAAMNIAKNPFLQKEYSRKKEAESRMEIAKMQVMSQMAASGAARAQDAAKMEEDRRRYEIGQDKIRESEEAKGDFLGKFYSSVPNGELNEAGQEEVANFQAFTAPEDPRTNPFIQETLQNPEFQQTEPVMDMTGNRFAQQFADESPEVQQLALNFMQARQKDAPTISRVVNQLNPETGEYEQIARDQFGNPIANYGPPKPSGMYRTPKEAREEEILVGRTKDAMAFNKESRNNSNIAISQAEQAQKALKYLPETTGGLTSFVNEMKVIAESLGIDLPEGYQKDMADIGAFRQLTGQFLFDAMSNTKGAITEREMVLFRQIAPDIDNSRAANKLMLEIYVKGGDRAKKRRDLIRDLQRKDVDPRQIQIAIEDFDDANSFMDDIRSLPRKTNSNNTQAQLNRPGVRGGNPSPNSNAQTPGGFQIK